MRRGLVLLAATILVAGACGSAEPATSEPPSASIVSTATVGPTSISPTTPLSIDTSSAATPQTGSQTTSSPDATEATTTSLRVPDPELLAISVDREVDVPGGVPMDVFGPTKPGPWPAIVLFHGGGWVSGVKEDIEPLARRIAANGVVVFNAGYQVLMDGVLFPETFEQTACAVVAAGALSNQYGAIDGRLTVAGYSAGAHLGALTAFSSTRFAGECAGETTPEIAAFVGISGPYDSDAFPQLLLNFGMNRDADPETWTAGNPYTYLAERPDIDVLLLHGDLDFVVAPAMSTWFADALRANGNPVELMTEPDLDHFSIIDLDAGGAETARRVADHAASVAAGG